MDLRAAGPVAGLLGGLGWVVPWLAGPTGAGAVHLVGGALLLLALGAGGAGLVSRSTPWLRLHGAHAAR